MNKLIWIGGFILLALMAKCADGATRMIVAYPPGGGTDMVARIIAKNMPGNIIVENRGGASGLIGTIYAANAPADGKTLLMGHVAPNAINVGAFFEPPVRFDFNFAPVALVATSPLVLLSQTRPSGNVGQQIKWLRDHANSYASDGLGSLAHLQMKMLMIREINHIPYKGGGPAIVGFMAKEAEIMFSPAPVCISWIRAGKVKAIAQSSAKRSRSLPDLPTMVEAGYEGYESVLWWGVFAPVGTKSELVREYNTEINLASRYDGVQEWADTQAMDMVRTSSQEFATFVLAEQRRWDRVIAK